MAYSKLFCPYQTYQLKLLPLLVFFCDHSFYQDKDFPKSNTADINLSRKFIFVEAAS